MNHRPSHTMISCGIAVALAVSAAGCAKRQHDTAPVAAKDAPEVIEQAFQNTQSEIASEARNAVAAVRNDDPGAVLHLHDLSMRPGLTPEQQTAAGRCLVGMLDELRTSAAKGNKKAEDTLEKYRALK